MQKRRLREEPATEVEKRNKSTKSNPEKQMKKSERLKEGRPVLRTQEPKYFRRISAHIEFFFNILKV